MGARVVKPSSSSVSPGQALFVPLAVTGVCWYVSPNNITPVQGILAYLLLLMPWASYLNWKQSKRRDFPLFTLLASMHWVYFAQPLFFGNRRIPGFVGGEAQQELITMTLAMAVTGLVCLGLGMRVRIVPWEPANLPDLTDSPMSWPYLRVVMILGILMGLRGSDPYAFGEGGRQIMTLLQSVVPCTIFAFFFRKYVLGTAPRIDKALVLIFIASRVLVALSTGWLGTLVWPGIICALIYITEGRRIPVLTTVLVLASVLFLQVGKEAFRDVYWEHQAEGTMTERVKFWIEQSASRWSEAMNGKGSETSEGLATETVSRLSLLTQAAHVLDWTPEIVPFQHGRTYAYMAVTLIPRFLWPEKPSVSDANRFYQVAYGLTTENQLDKVSIAVGFLTEGYMNFGWWGVVIITFCVGLALGMFQKTFLAADSSTLFRCIGLAAIPGLMVLESQLAQYLAGLVQQAALTCLILLPIVKPRAQTAGSVTRFVRPVSGLSPQPQK
jgi:hypothetical protein